MLKFLGRYKKEVLLLTITLLFLFFTCELFIRIHNFGFTNAFTLLTNIQGIGQAGYIQASDNCEIIFELKPNITNGRYRFSKFETNSQGLRDKEYSIEKPHGVYRVAVLGDSFTMPYGEEIENAYHSVLEEKMNAEGSKIEFINFAVDAYSIGTYLAVLKYKAIKYDPDLVMIGFYVPNDMYWWTDPLYMCDYKPPKKENSEFFKSHFIRFIKQNSINLYKKIIKTQKNNEPINNIQINLPGVSWDEFYSIMADFKNFSYEHNLPIVWVLLPALSYGHSSHIYHPFFITKFCEIPSFYIIDTLPGLYEEYANQYLKEGRVKTEKDKDSFFKEFWTYPMDNHANYKAHKIFADIIIEKWQEYLSYHKDRYQLCINQLEKYYLNRGTGMLTIGNHTEQLKDL